MTWLGRVEATEISLTTRRGWAPRRKATAMSRISRVAASSAMAAAILFAPLAVPASAAQTATAPAGRQTVWKASAFDCAHWYTRFNWKGVGVPAGQMCHRIVGGGLHQRYESASFVVLGRIKPLNNWWIDFDFYDRNGRRYEHHQGPVNGQARQGTRTLWLNRQLRAGEACATMFTREDGGQVKMLARQCHGIH